MQSERSGGVPPLSIRAGRSTPFRSALEPNIRNSRSLLIDRHAGVLFPATLVTIAAYEAPWLTVFFKKSYYSLFYLLDTI